jgi:hypothetical protein
VNHAVGATRLRDADVGETYEEPRVHADARPRERRDMAALLAALVALLAAPLVIALIALRNPTWHPIWDLALTEMGLRDVGTIHTRLTGMAASRVGTISDPGSHPGPLGFYMMFPAYRAFGSTPWAMQVAAVSVHVAAIATILCLLWRRRRLELLLVTVAILAVLLRASGPDALTQAWNAYLPMLWWVVFLVAVWRVVCGDVQVLPVAVFAGSFCVQNNASYVVIVTGLTAVAITSMSVAVYRQRRDRRYVVRATKWTLVALGVGAAVWIPPMIDQFIGDGNLGLLWNHLGDWGGEPIGVRDALDVVLLHLNPWRLLSEGIFSGHFLFAIGGPKLPGVLLLAAWGITALIAIRLRHVELIRLHAVLAVALVLAVVTISRLDVIYWYRLLWLWGIHALLLLAMAWTFAVLVQRRLADATSRTMTKWARVAVTGAAIAFTIVLAVDAIDVEFDRRDSRVLEALVPQTVSALGNKQESTYFVHFEYATTSALSRGLMNELDRRGFDVRAGRKYRAEVRPHRVIKPQDADRVLVMIGGPDVEAWRAQPGVQEIAFVGLTGKDQAQLPAGSGTAVFLAPPDVYREMPPNLTRPLA